MALDRPICAGLLSTGLLLTACASPWSPPTPAEILAKPSQANIKDARFTLKAHVVSGALTMDLSGDGVMVFKPRSASHMRLQGSLGQIPVSIESIDVGGKAYSRTGTGKFDVKDDTSNEPDSWAKAHDPKLVAEETLPLGKAWHIQAKNSLSATPFDVWVRESDGYPLRYSGGGLGASDQTASGTLTMDFDKFNTGETIAAPDPSQIKPAAKTVTAKVGEREVLNNEAVTIFSMNPNANGQYVHPKAGDHFIAVDMLVENTGQDKLFANPFDFVVSDGAGYQYKSTYADVGQQFQGANLKPGDKVRGIIVFEVPTSATGLTLKGTYGEDSVSLTL